MSDTQNHRMEALEWWRQLTRLEQLEIVGKYSNGKDFEFIATSSSQIQKLYIVATAYKTDSIEKNKWRIENREQLREQRKKELKELIEKDKEMSDNKQSSVEWLVEQIKKDINLRLRGFDIDKALEQAEAMRKDEIKNAQMDMFIHVNNLPYGLEYLEKRQSAEDFSQQYYNETYGGNK